MDPYATHLPHLIRAVLMTGGPVLELGMGDYSTPVLLEFCEWRKVTLVSVENDPVWMKKFKDRFESTFKQCFLVGNDWAEFKLNAIATFSVIFLDLHPPEYRKPILEKIWERGDIIVAHDSEMLDFDWTRFKYHREFTSPEGPRTMLASNVLDVTK